MAEIINLVMSFLEEDYYDDKDDKDDEDDDDGWITICLVFSHTIVSLREVNIVVNGILSSF